MKKILFGIILLIGIQACKEQELPEINPLDKQSLAGNWITNQRDITVSLKRTGKDNSTYYVDSTYTQQIDIKLNLNADGTIEIKYAPYSNGMPSSEKTVSGKWSAGKSNSDEYSDGKEYFIVFDPAYPHQQKSDEWLTTYTILERSGSRLKLGWTLNQSNARDSQKFTAVFSK